MIHYLLFGRSNGQSFGEISDFKLPLLVYIILKVAFVSTFRLRLVGRVILPRVLLSQPLGFLPQCLTLSKVWAIRVDYAVSYGGTEVT
jgi:hypothetical protein